jgi:regulator of protease activity HflC (stomatin/prohibitin superfamily)
MITFLSILLVLVVWAALGFRIIREDERAVVVRLGKPDRFVDSGFKWTLWPLEYVRRFTKNLIQLNFTLAGIITARGMSEDEKIEYGEANIGVETTMYFRWPEGNDLLETIQIIGNPENKAGLVDIFEESVLDAFRSVGGHQTWRKIVQDRRQFAADVLNALVDEPDDPIKLAKLQNVKLVIKHLNLPDNLKNAITKPEIARIELEAARADAEAKKVHLIKEGEGNKEKISREGEAAAYARQKLFEAIGNEPENIQKETLLTLREMAKGTSNTILFGIPSQITDSFGNVFGKRGVGPEELRKLFPGFTDEKISDFLKELIDRLSKTGGK